VTLVRRALAEVRTAPVLLVGHLLGSSMAGDGLDRFGFMYGIGLVFLMWSSYVKAVKPMFVQPKHYNSPMICEFALLDCY